MNEKLKRKLTTIISILFFIILILDIYAVTINNKTLEMLFKPLLMTLVAVIYLTSSLKPNFFYISALFFSFWGDVLLLFENNFLIPAIISFFMAHMLYIKIVLGYSKKISIKSYVINTIPFLFFFIGVMFVIKDNVGGLFIHVFLYGLIISAFGVITLINYSKKSTIANKFLLIGATLFIISDGFLAITRFYFHSFLFYTINISLYGISQYLICRGILKKEEKHYKNDNLTTTI